MFDQNPRDEEEPEITSYVLLEMTEDGCTFASDLPKTAAICLLLGAAHRLAHELHTSHRQGPVDEYGVTWG